MRPGRGPEEPRVEDRTATPAGQRHLRLHRLRPRPLPGSRRRNHQWGKAWGREPAGPAPRQSQSGAGTGLGRGHMLREPLARPLQRGGRQQTPPGLYLGCQLRGAANSVPAGHAGSKPRPREVAFCLKHLPPGEAALWQGGNSEPLLLLGFLRGPLYVSLSPSSPVLPLHTDTRLP